MTSNKNWSPRMRIDIGTLEIDLSEAYTFCFCSSEYDSCFKFLDDFIIKECFSIFRDGAICLLSHGRDYIELRENVYILQKNKNCTCQYYNMW